MSWWHLFFVEKSCAEGNWKWEKQKDYWKSRLPWKAKLERHTDTVLLKK